LTVESIAEGVAASKEAGAGGSAGGRCGVAVGETGALPGECVEVWGFDFGVAVAAEIAIAEVVGGDEEEVELG